MIMEFAVGVICGVALSFLAGLLLSVWAFDDKGRGFNPDDGC